ncbi:hypothetical protein H312_00141 [Anncaliia algerae PRA339]|uniref:Ribosomal protein L7Ae/L30e/S12e/Gadd45 domain-containing protein n=1 Tax=Anncaliia algerae PRA339 TaxID=1288291 RepID=A0A059F5C4_9MICR|nr:hypothetical protein H312_00141 [Anncaliia algerae PRA339]
MKKIVHSYLHNINAITEESLDNFYKLIEKENKFLLTYNQIMKHMKSSFDDNKIGIIFICYNDSDSTYLFHHLILFCKYFKIKLIKLPKGSRKYLETLLERKYIYLIGVLKNDRNYDSFKRI